jgi:thymidylate kinase
LEQLSPVVWAAALRHGRPAFVRRGLARAGRLVTRVLQARQRRGVSVALLGPDGAGKSTLAAGLQRSFVLPARQIYMGLTGGWLERVDRLRLPGLVRLGRVGVIWGRYLRGQYHTLRGRLVVFERYTFDAVAPTPMKLGRMGRLARWLDGRACPAPDLVLILDAPGTLMHQRKGEYTPETLEHWRQRFRTLEHRLSSVAVLDTTRPPEVVLAEATECIWKQYVRRWSRS